MFVFSAIRVDDHCSGKRDHEDFCVSDKVKNEMCCDVERPSGPCWFHVCLWFPKHLAVKDDFMTLALDKRDEYDEGNFSVLLITH